MLDEDVVDVCSDYVDRELRLVDGGGRGDVIWFDMRDAEGGTFLAIGELKGDVYKFSLLWSADRVECDTTGRPGRGTKLLKTGLFAVDRVCH